MPETQVRPAIDLRWQGGRRLASKQASQVLGEATGVATERSVGLSPTQVSAVVRREAPLLVSVDARNEPFTLEEARAPLAERHQYPLRYGRVEACTCITEGQRKLRLDSQGAGRVRGAPPNRRDPIGAPSTASVSQRIGGTSSFDEQAVHAGHDQLVDR